MPRADRNPIEYLLETVLPRPVIDVLFALGRFVYVVLFSRSLDPDSWTASLLAPLITLLIAYASLVVAYRTMRNTFQLAWFGVKYGALIGGMIAIYSWWVGEAQARGGRAGAGINDIIGGAVVGAGGLVGGEGGGGGGGGGLNLLGTLGQLGQGGALLGQLQNDNNRAGAGRGYNDNRPRRSKRLRNGARNRRAAAPERQAYAHPALDRDLADPDYDPSEDEDEDEDVALTAVKHVIRWLSHTTDANDRPAAGRRRAAAGGNPLFPQAGEGSASRRRRRRRSSSADSDLD
ncbi:hypothetical protein OC835_006366 [Tilletia horrida]|nr:hypothetical protein OC835_006366 [Tilletia horrida]KAK0553347.1 hypothetical protein OC844_006317 [Tilletia horrida]